MSSSSDVTVEDAKFTSKAYIALQLAVHRSYLFAIIRFI